MRYRVLIVAGLISGPAVAAEPARLGDGRFRAGGPVGELVFSPDGTELTSWARVGPGVVRRTVWDPATGRPLRAADEAPAARVRLSPASLRFEEKDTERREGIQTADALRSQVKEAVD